MDEWSDEWAPEFEPGEELLNRRCPWVVTKDGRVLFGMNGDIHDDLLSFEGLTMEDVAALGEITSGGTAEQIRPAGHEYEDEVQEAYEQDHFDPHTAAEESWEPAFKVPADDYKFIRHRPTGKMTFWPVRNGRPFHDQVIQQSYAPGEDWPWHDWSTGFATVWPGKMPQLKIYEPDGDPELENYAWNMLQDQYPELDWSWRNTPQEGLSKPLGSVLSPAFGNYDPDDLPAHLGGKRIADYQGWTNWDTWNTKLMMDNDYSLYQEWTKLAESGRWRGPNDVRDWAVAKVIGPHNRNAIADAREWNSIPREERIDHNWENLKNESPQAADLADAFGFGEDIEDTEPTLIDPELVNWHEIWEHIREELDLDGDYQREQDNLRNLGIGWPTPGHDVALQQMRDAFYRYHGAIPDEEIEAQGLKHWDHPQAYHNIRINIPAEQIPEVYHNPENYFGGNSLDEIAQRGYYPESLHELAWRTISDIHSGRPTPYADVMVKALQQRGYTPEQIEEMMRQRQRWEPDRQGGGHWVDLRPQADKAKVDPSLDRPGDLTIPNEWISKTAVKDTSEQGWNQRVDQQLAEPYKFQMPLDVEQRFVDMYECPECAGHLRAGDGLYCEQCGWRPRKVATAVGDVAERAAYVGRLMHKYLTQGASWFHVAQMAQAFITRQWPDMSPDQIDQIMRSAASLAQSGREPSIEDMGNLVSIPSTDQFSWGGEMGNDPRWSKVSTDDWTPAFGDNPYTNDDYEYYKQRRPWVWQHGSPQVYIGNPGEFHPYPRPEDAWTGEIWEDTSPPTFKILQTPRSLPPRMSDPAYMAARERALAEAQRAYFQQQDNPEQRTSTVEGEDWRPADYLDASDDTEYRKFLYNPDRGIVDWAPDEDWKLGDPDFLPSHFDQALDLGIAPYAPGVVSVRPDHVSLKIHRLPNGMSTDEIRNAAGAYYQQMFPDRPIVWTMGTYHPYTDQWPVERIAADLVPGNEGHWVWLDGHVGFGGEHHEIARTLAQRLGYDPTQVNFISNTIARNGIPEGHQVAVGTIRGKYPQIYNSTVDRNAVWDDVARNYEGFSKRAGIKEDAQRAYESLHNTGGFSLTQSMQAANGAAYFTSYAQPTRVIPVQQFSPTDIVQWRHEVLPILQSDPNTLIGGWLDDGLVYLDVSRAFQDEQMAVQFGRENGQKAVWDGFNNREIRLDMPDENEIREARIRKLGKSVMWAAPIYSEDLAAPMEKTAFEQASDGRVILYRGLAFSRNDGIRIANDPDYLLQLVENNPQGNVHWTDKYSVAANIANRNGLPGVVFEGLVNPQDIIPYDSSEYMDLVHTRGVFLPNSPHFEYEREVPLRQGAQVEIARTIFLYDDEEYDIPGPSVVTASARTSMAERSGDRLATAYEDGIRELVLKMQEAFKQHDFATLYQLAQTVNTQAEQAKEFLKTNFASDREAWFNFLGHVHTWRDGAGTPLKEKYPNLNEDWSNWDSAHYQLYGHLAQQSEFIMKYITDGQLQGYKPGMADQYLDAKMREMDEAGHTSTMLGMLADDPRWQQAVSDPENALGLARSMMGWAMQNGMGKGEEFGDPSYQALMKAEQMVEMIEPLIPRMLSEIDNVISLEAKWVVPAEQAYDDRFKDVWMAPPGDPNYLKRPTEMINFSPNAALTLPEDWGLSS